MEQLEYIIRVKKKRGAKKKPGTLIHKHIHLYLRPDAFPLDKQVNDVLEGIPKGKRTAWFRQLVLTGQLPSVASYDNLPTDEELFETVGDFLK